MLVKQRSLLITQQQSELRVNIVMRGHFSYIILSEAY